MKIFKKNIIIKIEKINKSHHYFLYFPCFILIMISYFKMYFNSFMGLNPIVFSKKISTKVLEAIPHQDPAHMMEHGKQSQQ